MILNFLDPNLERIWRKSTLPSLPGNPNAPLIHRKLSQLYTVLGGLDRAGLKAMKGREVEKSGSVYRVTIDCGFVCFRLAGRDVADVSFKPPHDDPPGTSAMSGGSHSRSLSRWSSLSFLSSRGCCT